MKKILTLLTLAVVLAVQTSVSAFTANKVETQKDVNKGTVDSIVEKKAEQASLYEQKTAELTNRYINNIRTCEPLHYTQYMAIFGLKLSVNIDINGWVDKKCNYKLSGKIGGLGKDIKEVFEINLSDETLSKFEPKVECNFTQKDLNTIVAALLARQEQNEVLVSQLLESPEKKYTAKKQITPEEEQLMALFTNGQACKILNKDELMNNFSELLNNGGL